MVALHVFGVDNLPVESERERERVWAQTRWFQHPPAARDVRYPTNTPRFYHPAASPVKTTNMTLLD